MLWAVMISSPLFSLILSSFIVISNGFVGSKNLRGLLFPRGDPLTDFCFMILFGFVGLGDSEKSLMMLSCTIILDSSFFFFFCKFWLRFVFNLVDLIENIAAPLALESFVNYFVIAEIKLMLLFIRWLFRVNMFVNSNLSTFNYFQLVFRPKLLMII